MKLNYEVLDESFSNTLQNLKKNVNRKNDKKKIKDCIFYGKLNKSSEN